MDDQALVRVLDGVADLAGRARSALANVERAARRSAR